MKRLFLMGLYLAGGANVSAAEPGCRDPLYAQLDFWVGEWTVWAGDEQAGHNRIEKILGGCALLEHWTSASGGEGKSLFYVDDAGAWQQVWVTERATEPGGVKAKTQVDDAPESSVRFQGVISRDGGSYLDRTTLTPNEDGSVRQLIEISTDDGMTWTATFDAVYRRVAE